jgi:peptide-methionine (S)-S-oxide reductase
MIKAVATAFFLALVATGASAVAALAKTETAIFAGGCFWCVESDFDKIPGVLSTTSGYIGGSTENPTYRNHSAARHREAVEIKFDPAKVSYEALLDAFWHSVDPTDGGGQFCDRGHSYTTAIYTVGPGQAKAAKTSKTAVAKALKTQVATEIMAAPRFWPAEDYHQNYYRKSAAKYKYYRFACGRDARIKEIWGPAAFQGIAAH